jgi:hypothetical protein
VAAIFFDCSGCGHYAHIRADNAQQAALLFRIDLDQFWTHGDKRVDATGTITVRDKKGRVLYEEPYQWGGAKG